MSTGTRVVLGVGVLSFGAALLLPALPQPPEYHQFADRRIFYGIANFLDVVSNVGFLVAGLAGLVIVFRRETVFERPIERWPYAIFFLGMLLTSVGSAYYHLAPDNERLFWDRLPMTVAFMSLIAAQVVDRLAVRAGLALLLPLLALGAASVLHWRATERLGGGNVLPYAILQGASVVLLLLLAYANPSRYSNGTDVYWVFAGYVLAKVFESADHATYALGHVLSGHTIKHVVAAVAGAVVCRMLLRRTLCVPGGVPPSAEVAPGRT